MIGALTDPNDSGAATRSMLAESDLLAPHLIDLEVARGLRRIDRLSPDDMTEALNRFRLLSIRRFEHAPLLPRIWDLRHNLTAYDGAYVALAEVTHALLVTTDRKVASAPGHNAEVVLV